MGQIRQQAAKYSLVSIIATAVSAIATVTIYARERELYGLLGYLMDTALMFSPFIILSTSSSVQRYFPRFKDRTGQAALFTLGIVVILIGAVIFTPVFFILKHSVLPALPSYAQENYAENFFYFILPISIAYALINYMFSYASIFKKIAIPAVFQMGNKFFTPIVVLLFYFNIINTQIAVILLIAFYFLSLVGIFLYLYSVGVVKFRSPLRTFQSVGKKEYLEFSGFSLFTVFGKQLAERIDGFMVPLMFTVGMNGEYRIAAFMAGVILIPFRSIASLMAPMISKAWSEMEVEEIQKMYRNSSKHSLIVGFFIFLMIYFNIDALLMVMPRGEELIYLKSIFLIIALARLVDLGSGVNDQIITYSRFFRFNFYVLFLLGISNVVLNLILAERLGFLGIAWATSISLLIFNVIKMIFIYIKFGIHPFGKDTMRLLLIFFFSCVVLNYLPSFKNPWIAGVANSFFIALIFLPLVYFFKISESWNQLLRERVKKIINEVSETG